LIFCHAGIVVFVLVSIKILETINAGQFVAVSTLLGVMFLYRWLLQLLPASIASKVDHGDVNFSSLVEVNQAI